MSVHIIQTGMRSSEKEPEGGHTGMQATRPEPEGGNDIDEPTSHNLSGNSRNTDSSLSKSLGDVTAGGDIPQSDSDDDILDPIKLRDKIAAVTSGEKPFRIRRKTFSESDASSRSERCDLCGETFRTALQLRRHVMVHSRQRSLDLPSKRLSDTPQRCTECKKVFENVTYLEKHKLRRHSSESYSCDVCLMTFESKPLRDSHRRSHFGENPFSCCIT